MVTPPRRLVHAGLFLAILGTTTAAEGKTWRVEADGSGELPTLQTTINASASGDSILLGAGTYPGQILIADKSLTLIGEHGADQTILDGFNTGFRILTVIRSGRPVVLKGLTFWRGFAARGDFLGSIGGAVAGLVSPLVIQQCVFRDNWSLGTGASVYCTIGFLPQIGGPIITPPDPSLVIEDSFFEGGNSGDEGGAVYACETSAFIKDCTFRKCHAVQGGAVATLRKWATFMGCRFEENDVDKFGGAVYCAGMDQVTVDGCVFRKNNGFWRGGGIEVRGAARFTLTASAFVDNTAARGGGVFVWNGSLAAERVAWFGGTSTEFGGGLYLDEVDDASFTRCTWLGNTAPRGASLTMPQGTLWVQQSLLGDEDGRAADCAQATVLSGCNVGGSTTGGCLAIEDRVQVEACESSPEYLCSLPGLPGCPSIGHADEVCPPSTCATPVHPTTWGALKDHYR